VSNQRRLGRGLEALLGRSLDEQSPAQTMGPSMGQQPHGPQNAESGAGDAGDAPAAQAAMPHMSVDDQENDALKSRLGVNVAYQWHWGEIPVVPEAFIGWEHEFLADEADLTARFAAGGGSFTLDTGSPNEDGLYFGGGVSALVRDDISVYVRYDGTVYDDLDVHAVSGGVTFRF